MIIIDKELNVKIEEESFNEAIDKILFIFFSYPFEEDLETEEKLAYLLKQLNKCRNIELSEYEDYKREIKKIEKKIRKIKEQNEK